MSEQTEAPKRDYRFLCTTSDRNGNVSAAIVHIVSRLELNPTWCTLQEALQRWVETTDSGRKLWEENKQELSVGDLLANAYDQDLQRLIREVGIVSLKLISLNVNAVRDYIEIISDV